MKVVLFCGGLGTRIREYNDSIPKPMVPVGYRPVLWHVMKYYASFGHTEFILALGYKADIIKEFFLTYNEATSNDFVLSSGGRQIDLLSSDIDEWKVTFVDTGISANLGERLMAVREHLGDDEMFLANYSDGLTDLPLDSYIDEFTATDKVAQFVAIQPPLSYHVVEIGDDSLVTRVGAMSEEDLWINGGYFVFRREIFDFMEEGEELVLEPFDRLVEQKLLMAHKYTGFWAPMDTFKDKQRLDDLASSGHAPWEVWKTEPETLAKS